MKKKCSLFYFYILFLFSIISLASSLHTSPSLLKSPPFFVQNEHPIKDSLIADNRESFETKKNLESKAALFQEESSDPFLEEMDEKGFFPIINFEEVFLSSPIIYSILLFLSLLSVAIWLYTLLTLRTKEIITKNDLRFLTSAIRSQNFDQAILYCEEKSNLFTSMILTALHLRSNGRQIMLDSMKIEGKRISASFWQRISILNDVVLISPMLGLLGTVLGMFYAFYDINRTQETLTSLFDGLGIAVGTTVGGLIVAIVAMILHATIKYRIVKQLNFVEKQAIYLTNLIPIDLSKS